jgi:PAS domain S-box-containing protein
MSMPVARRLRPPPGRAADGAAASVRVLAVLALALLTPPRAHAEPLTLRVGVYENPPKVFTARSGQPAGIFIDILEAIAQSEGWQLRYVPGTWAEGLARLSRGEIDLMPDVALTAPREARYAFPKVPVLSSWDQVYAARGSNIRSILDLDGKRLAVLEGSVQQETFSQLARGYGLGVTIVPMPSYEAAFAAAARGHATAALANNYFGSLHYRTYGLESTAILSNPCVLYFAAPKGTDRAFLDRLDLRLEALKNDPKSAYYASLYRWIGEGPRYTVPVWLRMLALVVAVALLVSAAASVVFKRQLNDRTRALRAQNAALADLNEALQNSERKYRELVEHANSIILHWTGDGKITFLNEYGQRFFGYSAEEIVGRSVMDTIVPETDSTGRAMGPLIEHVQTDPQAYESHVNENVRRNGERVWVAWTNKVAYDDAGEVAGVLSIGTDITERRRADEELRRLNAELERKVLERTADLAEAKVRAESADRLKSAFLAAMSHELRTPLNSIIGFTGIVLQGLPGPLNDEQAKQLTMVQSSARHLLDLISDILDLSKIEAGQLEVETKPFNVPAAVEHALRLIVPLAERKHLDVTSEVAPEVGELVGDRRRYEQVLINLLNNAVKFSEEGRVHVRCVVQGPDLVTAVSDTGIGIKPEDLARLFQPFRQLDTGLTRNHEGSGLGLSICQRLVTMMGGTIAVDSEWGRGSTFTFTLPLTPT